MHTLPWKNRVKKRWLWLDAAQNLPNDWENGLQRGIRNPLREAWNLESKVCLSKSMTGLNYHKWTMAATDPWEEPGRSASASALLSNPTPTRSTRCLNQRQGQQSRGTLIVEAGQNLFSIVHICGWSDEIVNRYRHHERGKVRTKCESIRRKRNASLFFGWLSKVHWNCKTAEDGRESHVLVVYLIWL